MHIRAPITAASALLLAMLLGPIPTRAPAQDAAKAATPANPALMTQGQALYATNCVTCHQATGLGNPPTFPALAGDAKLSDLGLIAGNIHNGKGNMPALPNLSAAEIAALATYIRNSWGNSFGGVAESEVATIIGGGAAAGAAASAGASRTIWDGIYTEAQAERGAPVVSGTCSKCHGRTLNGAGQPDQPPSPAIARVGFLGRWEGRTVEALFDYIKSTMPKDNPGQLTDQQYADVIAVMLSMSKVPAGSSELAPDPAALRGIAIKKQAP
jgi:mono/diheme cytochrome c family protein